MSYPNPIIDGMCKDLVRNAVALKGLAFLEQEVLYYKTLQQQMQQPYCPLPEHTALPGPPAVASAPTPAPAPAPAPASAAAAAAANPLPVPIKTEKIIIVDAAPAVAVATAAPAQNHVVEVHERTRYKRAELPDAVRCTATTSRGSRCTLEREASNTLCSRHIAKQHGT